MDAKEQREFLGRPQVQRLKDLGMGLKVSRVLGDRVLVKPVTPWTEMDEVEKKGLLYVPEKVKDQNTPMPTTGVVVMVGPEVPNALNHMEDSDLWLNEGDMVMFSRYAGMDIVVDQGDFKLLKYNEIACVLEATNEDAIATLETK
jgi:chaperonin GroES